MNRPTSAFSSKAILKRASPAVLQKRIDDNTIAEPAAVLQAFAVEAIATGLDRRGDDEARLDGRRTQIATRAEI